MQVKVSVAGAQLLPCKQPPQGRFSILQLPVLLGSLGAVSIAASSSQQPSAAKPGSKVLSVSLAVGQLELSAAGQAGSNGSSGSGGGSSQPGVVFTLPGVSSNLHLAKMPSGAPQAGSRAGSGAGRSSSSGLRSRQRGPPDQRQPPPQQQQHQQQPPQQQWVLKATCSCQLKQQPQLQLHAAQLPALIRAAQLLQVSLAEIKAQRQAVADAAAAVAATTGAVGHSRQGSVGDDQLLLEASLSPAVSLSSLPRPETPSLTTPCMSPSPHPPSTPDGLGGTDAAGATAAAAEPAAGTGGNAAVPTAAAAAGGVAGEDSAGRRSLASFGSGMLQRLPSKLLFGGSGGADARDAELGLMAELSVANEAGWSIEVTDSKGAVACWVSMQEVEAGAVAEWIPASRASSNGSGRGGRLHSDLGVGQQEWDNGTLQLSAHALLQQLAVSVAPCAHAAASASGTAATAAATAGQRGLPLHKLVQLDSASLQIGSYEGDDVAPALESEVAQPLAAKQPLPLQLSALAGRLQVAAGVAALQPLFTLLEQLYVPAVKRSPSVDFLAQATGSSTAAAGKRSQLPVFEAAAAAMAAGAKKAKKQPKAAWVVLAAVEVQLQACEVSITQELSASSIFATDAAREAAAAGMQTHLLLSLSGVQLSVLPPKKQLGASLELLQVGYKASCPGGPTSLQSPQQSVELLLLQGVQVRQYSGEGLQLVKVAVQQLRSDNHIDVVLAGASAAAAVLQLGLSCVQQLHVKHASAAAVAASRQAAAAAVAAAATGELQAAREAAEAASTAAAALDEQGLIRGDSFSALAVQPILDSIRAGGVGADTDEPFAGQQLPLSSSSGASLPPAAARPSSGSSTTGSRAAPRQLKQKPVFALEARVCDVAVQLSVCEKDALMVQVGQLNYSSVLEQAVITKLRFAINDRTVVQVPHAAVHNVPGWLPPGATAAAVAAAATASDPAKPVNNISSSFAGMHQPGAPGPGPSATDGLSDGAGAATNMQRPAQAPAAAAAGWQEAQGAGESGGMSSLAFLDYPSPCSSLGSKRPAADADPALYSRQAARQAAGRERCKVPEGNGPPAAAADAGGARGVRGGGGGSLTFGRRDEGVKGPGTVDGGEEGAAAGAVISLNVYAERVLFSVPHDEAPGRIIVVTETWAKAVKEVREPGFFVISVRLCTVGITRNILLVHSVSCVDPLGGWLLPASSHGPAEPPRPNPLHCNNSVNLFIWKRLCRCLTVCVGGL